MPHGRLFTYDGLYRVKHFTFAPSASAAAHHQCKRYTFFLTRLPDQTALFEVLPFRLSPTHTPCRLVYRQVNKVQLAPVPYAPPY